MSKVSKTNKETKKPALLTPKEKKAVKDAKKLTTSVVPWVSRSIN
jgi:hypothetical protein